MADHISISPFIYEAWLVGWWKGFHSQNLQAEFGESVEVHHTVTEVAQPTAHHCRAELHQISIKITNLIMAQSHYYLNKEYTIYMNQYLLYSKTDSKA